MHFTKFWTECEEVLLPDYGVEERRGSDCIYLSGAYSILNQIKLVTDNLHHKVDDGDLLELHKSPL